MNHVYLALRVFCFPYFYYVNVLCKYKIHIYSICIDKCKTKTCIDECKTKLFIETKNFRGGREREREKKRELDHLK